MSYRFAPLALRSLRSRPGPTRSAPVRSAVEWVRWAVYSGAVGARVVVVGAGVSGLTCAVRLLEAGYDVAIWARDLPEHTTSAVAAALWYPLREFVDARAKPLADVSYGVFVSLAEGGTPGVALREGIEVWRGDEDESWWREHIPRCRPARDDEVPAGYGGMLLQRVPVVEMPVYLRWLSGRARSLGASIERRAVGSIDVALAAADVVVNCAGLGARELAGDGSVTPIRGQVVWVSQVGIERFLLDERGPHPLTYVVPRSRDVVLGGTREYGVSSLDPDAGTARAILERAIALEPRLRDAEVLEHRVGLRPGRPSLRLEAEERAGQLVVHDYGHGGSGVTLSWGCADEVVKIVRGTASPQG